MSHMLQLLPAIGCVAMMFGVGAIGRLVSRTPLGRAIARRDRLASQGHGGRPLC
jgi:hypothetical protein